MKTYHIRNAKIVNEDLIFEGDVLVRKGRIERVGSFKEPEFRCDAIDANGKFLIPGAIDDQVHFREPGLTHKGDIASESRAAVAGGITSFIEQPNTVPNAVTLDILEQKYDIAARTSFANYSFMLGATNDNLEQVKRMDPRRIAGIKIFMGSSTGNMLVDDSAALEAIFRNAPSLIAVHCEDEQTIRRNLEMYKEKYTNDIPPACHPEIRSAEACYISSSAAVALARQTGARLHVFHLSTEREMELFGNDLPLEQKKITAEVCIHHLMFSDRDYADKGNLIKWNPAVKSAGDQDALWKALLNDTIDVIATDHAPHTLEEKMRPYLESPSGGPMVQHAVVAMFDAFLEGKISVERIVRKMAHNPAILFAIENRGFIREGYFADLAIVDPAANWTVGQGNILSKCGWSPFDGHEFRSRVTHTFVNGELAFDGSDPIVKPSASRLTFAR